MTKGIPEFGHIDEHAVADSNRPSLVVEWMDGRRLWYPLANASWARSEDGGGHNRVLVIKYPGPDGQQDYRIEIPFEVLRGWTVYPRRTESNG